jgi:phosphopantetheinyl transferase
MTAKGGQESFPLQVLECGRLPPDVRWLLCRWTPDLKEEEFLLPEELQDGRRYRHAGRHRQWLLGRAAAKWLLLEQAGLNWSSQNARRFYLLRHPDGWPQVFSAAGEELALTLTISHSADYALCALSERGAGALGADLEVIEKRSQALIEDFFTEREKDLLRAVPFAERDRAVNAVWCLKEALLKAAKTGLRRRATDVEVRSLGGVGKSGWQEAQIRISPGGVGSGWWKSSEDGRLVLALGMLQGE